MHVYVWFYIFMYMLINKHTSPSMLTGIISAEKSFMCNLKDQGSSKSFAVERRRLAICVFSAQILPAHTPPWHLATTPVRRTRPSPATSPGLVPRLQLVLLLCSLLSHVILALTSKWKRHIADINADYYSQSIEL